jgi:hypothetical protein
LDVDVVVVGVAEARRIPSSFIKCCQILSIFVLLLTKLQPFVCIFLIIFIYIQVGFEMSWSVADECF